MSDDLSANPFADFGLDELVAPAEFRPVDPLKPENIFKILGKAFPDRPSNERFVVDIETGPRPWHELDTVVEPFADIGEFDPKTVKVGNIKDKDLVVRQEKIDAKIKEKREEHEAERAGGQEAWAAKIIASATTDARLCNILAIGYSHRNRNGEDRVVLDTDDLDGGEAGMLNRFWAHFDYTRNGGGKIGGAYVKKFDLPVIARRSMFLGVQIPNNVLQQGRYLDKCVDDLIDQWSFGVYGGEWPKVNDLAKFFGVRTKTEDIGAIFWQYYKSDRPRAMSYLEGDVLCELDLIYRMQIWT